MLGRTKQNQAQPSACIFGGLVENRTSNSLINKISVLEIEIIRKLLVTVLLVSLYVGYVGCDKELLWGSGLIQGKWTLIQHLFKYSQICGFLPFLSVSYEVMFFQVSNPFHSMPYHLTWETFASAPPLFWLNWVCRYYHR